MPQAIATRAVDGTAADDAALNLRGATIQGLGHSPDVQAARFRADSFEQTELAAMLRRVGHSESAAITKIGLAAPNLNRRVTASQVPSALDICDSRICRCWRADEL